VLLPKIVTALKDYNREKFLGDLTAGVIVGVVALPLAIAFAIASGVTPDRGLWTAIVAGFLISLLGGSRVQIGGPTGAFVVIVYGIVQKYGIDGLTVATLMAGVILIGMGIAKLGTMIKFIPHPIITGFTSGIALIIFSGEIKDFFGLRMGVVPADFIGKWLAYANGVTGVTPSAIAVSSLALGIILIWPRVNRRIPGPFVALIVTTLLVKMMHLPVETIATRFGGISASVPHPQIPHLSLVEVTALVGPAFTIAFLAAIESLLSAVVADGMIGGRHRSNMELIAQGVANVAAPLFGGIPATGAIARTATIPRQSPASNALAKNVWPSHWSLEPGNPSAVHDSAGHRLRHRDGAPQRLMTEDEGNAAKEQIQELTKSYEAKIDDLIENKKKEIMSV